MESGPRNCDELDLFFFDFEQERKSYHSEKTLNSSHFEHINFTVLAAVVAISSVANTCSADLILAAWDTFNNTDATPDATGVIALGPNSFLTEFSEATSYSFGGDVRDIRGDDRGSNDGTFGSAISGANNPALGTLNDSLRVQNGVSGEERTLLINIDNSLSSDDLNFSTFHFDAGNNPNNGDTYSDVEVSFIDNAGVSTVLTNGSRSLAATATDGTTGSATGNYLDLDFDASGFSLAAGESGAFSLRFFDPNPANSVASAVHLDNIAITVADPTAVPEPTSLAVLGLAGLGFVIRRRR